MMGHMIKIAHEPPFVTDELHSRFLHHLYLAKDSDEQGPTSKGVHCVVLKPNGSGQSYQTCRNL